VENENTKLLLLKKLIANLDPIKDNEDLISQLIEFLDSPAPTTIPLYEDTLLPIKIASEKKAKLKSKIKEILQKDSLKALEELRNSIIEDNPLFNQVILSIATYNRINKFLLSGTINFQDAHQEFTKIDNAILYMIDEVEEEDLK